MTRTTPFLCTHSQRALESSKHTCFVEESREIAFRNVPKSTKLSFFHGQDASRQFAKKLRNVPLAYWRCTLPEKTRVFALPIHSLLEKTRDFSNADVQFTRENT